MDYISLSKLAYSSRNEYEQIYQERFNSQHSQHLDIKIRDYPAFFVTTSELSALALSIPKTDNKILSVCQKSPEADIKNFLKSYLIGEIILTNEIEGIRSTHQEINGILESLGKNNWHKRFAGMVEKYAMIQKGREYSLDNLPEY